MFYLFSLLSIRPCLILCMCRHTLSHGLSSPVQTAFPAVDRKAVMFLSWVVLVATLVAMEPSLGSSSGTSSCCLPPWLTLAMVGTSSARLYRVKGTQCRLFFFPPVQARPGQQAALPPHSALAKHTSSTRTLKADDSFLSFANTAEDDY